MRLFSEKTLRFENHLRGNIATTDLRLIVKNILGSFLILILSLLLILTLLIPAVFDAIRSGIFSQGLSQQIVVLASISLLGFLVAFPFTLLVQSLIGYRNARNLNRLGLMTKGLLVDKWVEVPGGKPVYYVCYTYLVRFNTVQTVDQDAFEQLKRNETVFVLYLEHLPHIARLDLD